MAYKVEVKTRDGQYYTIKEEGGIIHVWKPGWMGKEGLGVSLYSFDDALDLIEQDSGSSVDRSKYREP